MKVLLAIASKHHSTTEIGQAIPGELWLAGHDVSVAEPRQATLAGYDAVIVGSAAYMGHIMGEARTFLESNVVQLGALPVWIFVSGPVGDDVDRPALVAGELERLATGVGARGFRTFDGKLDTARLNFGERVIVRMVKAPTGDFRDWPAIRAWAKEIAAALDVPVGAAAR